MKQTAVMEPETEEKEPLVERFVRERQAEIGELRELPLVSLRESPWNPRTYFSDEKLAELADSIKGKGITTPLIVRPTSDGFEIGAGARRYRAARNPRHKG